MKTIIYFTISIIFIFLVGCVSQSNAKLYPVSEHQPIYRIGQSYKTKIDLNYALIVPYTHYGVLSPKAKYDKEDSRNIFIRKGAILKVTDVKKQFNGSFGRNLSVQFTFAQDGQSYIGFSSLSGIGKTKPNVKGYEVYLVPDPSKATLIQ